MTRILIRRMDIEIVADVEGPSNTPTVLFLHAGGEARQVWRPMTARLVSCGWQVIAPDLRGHGESGRSPQYKFDDFVDDAAFLIDELAQRPLVIVGGRPRSTGSVARDACRFSVPWAGHTTRLDPEAGTE